MAADSLLTHTPADSVALVQGVAALVGSWGLPPALVNGLVTLLLGLPTVAIVLLTRIPVFQWLAPAFHTWLDPVWNRNKTWLNPLLALLAGWLTTGNPAVGAAAVFLHQIVTGAVKAAKGTPATTAAGRVGTIALVLGLALMATPARAQSRATDTLSLPVRTAAGSVMPWLSIHRFVFTVAAGQSWTGWSSALPPNSYGRVGVGYQVLSPLQLNAGCRRWLSGGKTWQPEVELRLVIAP